MLDTSKQLEELPTVADAMRDGKLSATRGRSDRERRERRRPTRSKQLIETAQRSTLAELQKACLEARATGDREADHKRIKAERYLRTWTDPEGAWNLRARGTVDQGARFRAAIEPIIDKIFNDARTAQQPESARCVRVRRPPRTGHP